MTDMQNSKLIQIKYLSLWLSFTPQIKTGISMLQSNYSDSHACRQSEFISQHQNNPVRRQTLI